MPKVAKLDENKRADIHGVDTITIDQLAYMFQVGETKARELMIAIKSVSDTLTTSGICHLQDYNAWLKIRLGRTKYIDRAQNAKK